MSPYYLQVFILSLLLSGCAGVRGPAKRTDPVQVVEFNVDVLKPKKAKPRVAPNTLIAFQISGVVQDDAGNRLDDVVLLLEKNQLARSPGTGSAGYQAAIVRQEEQHIDQTFRVDIPEALRLRLTFSKEGYEPWVGDYSYDDATGDRLVQMSDVMVTLKKR